MAELLPYMSNVFSLLPEISLLLLQFQAKWVQTFR